MLEELAITGVGMVTPLGGSTAETWEALLFNRSITTHTRLPIESEPGTSRLGGIAATAAFEAVREAGWAIEEDDGLALVLGTSKGPIESWIAGTEPATRGTPAAAGGPAFGLASTAHEVAARLGLAAVPRITISAACASGLHALIRGCLMLRCGQADRVLVVAAEASVHPLFLGSFERLGVLAPPGEPCRPFDERRSGFLMSEAAAAVCLERRSGRQSALVCVGPALMGADAHGLVAADPNAVALRRILHTCAADGPVDLCHAHGTGTLLNDAIELTALEHTFATHTARAPSVYSHKAAIGHTLGAAGLLGIAISIQCHRHGIVPGNVNSRVPMQREHLTISASPVHRPIHRSITCASGFGGALAAVTLRKCG